MPQGTAVRVYRRSHPGRSRRVRAALPRQPAPESSLVPLLVEAAADLVALYFAVQLVKALVELFCLLVAFEFLAALLGSTNPRD